MPDWIGTLLVTLNGHNGLKSSRLNSKQLDVQGAKPTHRMAVHETVSRIKCPEAKGPGSYLELGPQAKPTGLPFLVQPAGS